MSKELTIHQKLKISQMFIDKSNIGAIMKSTKIDDSQIIYDYLLYNELTKEKFLEEYERYQQGYIYHFFNKVSPDAGRKKLPDNERKKLRQIRISDKEMEELGNPSSERIRKDALIMKNFREFCKLLDNNKRILIPDDWIKQVGHTFVLDYYLRSNFDRFLGVIFKGDRDKIDLQKYVEKAEDIEEKLAENLEMIRSGKMSVSEGVMMVKHIFKNK